MDITTYVLGDDTPASLKAIAARLRELASHLPATCSRPHYYRAEVVLGRFRVTCAHSRPALRAVAAQYDRGLPRELTFTAPSARRATRASRPAMDAFLRFWDDGERENALEYLRQWPQDLWPSAAVDRMNAEDFTWNN